MSFAKHSTATSPSTTIARQPPARAKSAASPAPPSLAPVHPYTAILQYALDVGKLLKAGHLWESLDGAGQARLGALGVRFTSLNLDSGVRESVRPISISNMRAWLEETQPWKDRGYGSGGDPDLDNWWNAKAIGGDLISYVANDWRHETCGIMDKTKWARRLRKPELPLRSARNERYWYDIDFDLECTDKSFPHISAFLYQHTPVRDSEVGAVELWSIIQLAAGRVRDREDPWLGVLPITLISASGRNVRIIHAIFDGVSRQIDVHKSSLLKFDTPGCYETDEWMRVLCWFVAEPCGLAKSTPDIELSRSIAKAEE